MVEGSALHLDQRAQLADAGRARTGEGSAAITGREQAQAPTATRGADLRRAEARCRSSLKENETAGATAPGAGRR